MLCLNMHKHEEEEVGVATARSFGQAVEYAWEFPGSAGKHALWVAFLSTVTEEPGFHIRTSREPYLCLPPKVLKCQEGVATYTADESHHLFVHHIVPSGSGEPFLAFVLEKVHKYLRMLYPNHRIAYQQGKVMVPEDVSEGKAAQSEFPAMHRVLQPPLDPEKVTLLWKPEENFVYACGRYVGLPAYSIVRPEDVKLQALTIRSCTAPLMRCKDADPLSALYWHRFPCGTLVTVRNPLAPPHSIVEHPPKRNRHEELLRVFNANEHPGIHGALVALQRGTLPHCLAMIQSSKNIPEDIRTFFVLRAIEINSLSDELFFGIADHFIGASLLAADNLVSHAIHMARVLRAGRIRPRLLSADQVLCAVCDIILPSRYRTLWHSWFLQSYFILTCVAHTTLETLHACCKRFDPMCHVTANLLRMELGAWNRVSLRRAHLIIHEVPSKNNSNVMMTVKEELQRQERAQAEQSAEWQQEEDGRSEKKKGKGKKKNRVSRVCRQLQADASAPIALEEEACTMSTSHCCEPDKAEETELEPNVDPVVTESTHHALMRVLQERLGADYTCTLLGSGIFSEAGDLDVAVAVPLDKTLEDAHEELRERMCWTAHYERVSEEHVAVLKGTLKHVSLDVQLWHGPEHVKCAAERCTAKAVALACQLERDTTRADRLLLAELHQVCNAASLKGHAWSRLPGVAVTAIGLVLLAQTGHGDSAATTLRSVLEAWKKSLEVEFPSLDLEQMESSHACKDRHRPVAPVTVLIQGANVATRVTACTTRHLLDTLAFLCSSLSTSPPLSSEEVAAWRKRAMFPILRVKPRQGQSTVASSLYAALAKLDGNPLVESVFLEEEEGEEGLLVLWITMRFSQELQERYGFRAKDEVQPDAHRGHLVRVKRGQMVWTLACKPAPTVSLPSLEEVQNGQRCGCPAFLQFQGRMVPNAPSLTCDVWQCFDPRSWQNLDLK